MVSKGTVRQTQNSEKPSFHGYISDRCLLPVVRAGIRQIIFLLPITEIGDKSDFDFRWRTLTPSVFYYSIYVFHNLMNIDKMSSNSVQIKLFIILWVTRLIHNKQPMYAVLDKDTIKNEILPYLSVAKRGFISKVV